MLLTPCGPSAVPTGGAGVAEPACRATLTRAATFFLGGMDFVLARSGTDQDLPGRSTASCRRTGDGFRSDLLDLGEGQVDRGLAAQDLDQGLEPLAGRIDLGDRGV